MYVVPEPTLGRDEHFNVLYSKPRVLYWYWRRDPGAASSEGEGEAGEGGLREVQRVHQEFPGGQAPEPARLLSRRNTRGS